MSKKVYLMMKITKILLLFCLVSVNGNAMQRDCLTDWPASLPSQDCVYEVCLKKASGKERKKLFALFAQQSLYNWVMFFEILKCVSWDKLHLPEKTIERHGNIIKIMKGQKQLDGDLFEYLLGFVCCLLEIEVDDASATTLEFTLEATIVFQEELLDQCSLTPEKYLRWWSLVIVETVVSFAAWYYYDKQKEQQKFTICTLSQLCDACYESEQFEDGCKTR